jgi:hypothetical protein
MRTISKTHGERDVSNRPSGSENRGICPPLPPQNSVLIDFPPPSPSDPPSPHFPTMIPTQMCGSTAHTLSHTQYILSLGDSHIKRQICLDMGCGRGGSYTYDICIFIHLENVYSELSILFF